MLAQLPKHIQEQVISYLKVANFSDAKRLYDDWVAHDVRSHAKASGQHRINEYFSNLQ